DAPARPKPLDVTLSRSGNVITPGNTLTRTQIATDPSRGVTFAGSGVRFAPSAADGAAAPPLDGDKAVFADTAHAPAFVVARLPDGVETFCQLRSPASAEHHALRFDLPDGATLRPQV